MRKRSIPSNGNYPTSAVSKQHRLTKRTNYQLEHGGAGVALLLAVVCGFIVISFLHGSPDVGMYLLTMLLGPPLMLAIWVAVSRLFKKNAEADELSRAPWMSDAGYVSLLRAAAKSVRGGRQD